jgi:hypothetical protein
MHIVTFLAPATGLMSVGRLEEAQGWGPCCGMLAYVGNVASPVGGESGGELREGARIIGG